LKRHSRLFGGGESLRPVVLRYRCPSRIRRNVVGVVERSQLARACTGEAVTPEGLLGRQCCLLVGNRNRSSFKVPVVVVVVVAGIYANVWPGGAWRGGRRRIQKVLLGGNHFCSACGESPPRPVKFCNNSRQLHATAPVWCAVGPPIDPSLSM